MPRVCDVGECGVLAVGLCVSCERAFCDSHRKRIRYGQAGYANLCVDCTTPEAEASRIAREEILASRREESIRQSLEGASETRVELGRLVGLLVEHFPDETIPLMAEVTWEVAGLLGSRRREGYAIVDRLWPLGLVGQENRFALNRRGDCVEPMDAWQKLVQFDPDRMRIGRAVLASSKNPAPNWSRLETIERLRKTLNYRGIATD